MHHLVQYVASRHHWKRQFSLRDNLAGVLMQSFALHYCRRLIPGGICFLLAMTVCLSAESFAEDWAFRRSYFTHQLSPEVAATVPMPTSRSAYRIPTRPYNTGGTVRWSWRSNHINLGSGSNRDSQFLWERSVEFRP